MLEGIPREPETREQFAHSQHVDLKLVGFVASDDGKLGCSPEALIKGRQDGLEINVPTAPVHVGYMLDGPDLTYKGQVQAYDRALDQTND